MSTFMLASARVVLLASALQACAACAADGSHTTTIAIENMRFVPETATVRSGDRIRWTNRDLFPHTVSGTLFESRAIAAGASWTWVATKRGRHPYACSLHPTMTGVVVVE